MLRNLSFAALVLTLDQVTAMHKTFRPIDGTAPWHKEVPKEPELNFHHDYHVPTYGKDSDIIDSEKHLADQEKKHGVSNVQLGESLSLESDPICSSAGCTQYKHPKKDLGYELDYPVPNFGQDREIKDNFNSLSIAEKLNQHKWDFKLEKPPLNPAKKTLYNFAPTLDEDIKDSQKNLKDTEGVLGHKYDIMNLQLERGTLAQSDPICSSAGCIESKRTKKAKKAIVYYPDDTTPLDSDIKDSIRNEHHTSKSMGHNWHIGGEDSYIDAYETERTGASGIEHNKLDAGLERHHHSSHRKQHHKKHHHH